MNYKPLILLKLKEVSQKTDYTFGELLYSILRKKFLHSKPEDVSNQWIANVEDREFYTAIERFFENELKQLEDDEILN